LLLFDRTHLKELPHQLSSSRTSINPSIVFLFFWFVLSIREEEMAGTIIEQTRTFHEDIERLERTAVHFLLEDPKTVKDAVYQRHLVGACVERMIDRNKQLVDLYRDEDSLKKEEIAAMGGSGPTAFTNFYDRLRELKEYHRKFSIEPPTPNVSFFFLKVR